MTAPVSIGLPMGRVASPRANPPPSKSRVCHPYQRRRGCTPVPSDCGKDRSGVAVDCGGFCTPANSRELVAGPAWTLEAADPPIASAAAAGSGDDVVCPELPAAGVATRSAVSKGTDLVAMETGTCKLQAGTAAAPDRVALTLGHANVS
jgi:hypothetical protein